MSGDAYVSATLEALISDPSVIDEAGGPRVALYRLFTKLWNSVAINGQQSGVAADARVEHVQARHLQGAGLPRPARPHLQPDQADPARAGADRPRHLPVFQGTPNPRGQGARPP